MDELALSIGDLARRTGVDISTLRRWERYDGLLTPTRTPGGQRRYGAEDIAAVEELVALIGKGWAAASAARAVADHRDTGAVVFDASLLDAVPAGVIVTNSASEVLYANPAIAAMLGVTPAELEAAGGGDFLEEDEREHVIEAFQEMRRGEPQTYDVRMRARHGEYVEVEVAAGPLLGPGGQVRGIVGVFSDQSRRRSAERRAELLGHLIDATDDAVLAVSTDLLVVECNAAASTLGVDGVRAGDDLSAALPPELAAPTIEAVRRALAGEPSTFELRTRTGEDGTPPIHRQVRVRPLRADAALVVAVDVVAPPDEAADLSATSAHHAVVAALTQAVLAGSPPVGVVETAVRGIGRALDASHVSFVEVVPPEGALAVLASTVEEPLTIAPPTEPFASHVAFALQSLRPIMVRDFDREKRFDRGPFAGEQAARSGLCVPVRWRPDGLGAISVHSDSTRRDLGPAEVTFVQSTANVCAIALQGRDGRTTEVHP